MQRLHKGDLLVTVATGELSKADEDRTGLVPSHAYAVLDARKVHVSAKSFYFKKFIESLLSS